MPDNKDYSKVTLEELLIEEKKLKKNNTIGAVLIGCFVGIMIFGIVKNGLGFLYIFISLILISWIYKSGQKNQENLKQVQAAIKSKNAV